MVVVVRCSNLYVKLYRVLQIDCSLSCLTFIAHLDYSQLTLVGFFDSRKSLFKHFLRNNDISPPPVSHIPIQLESLTREHI